MNKAELIKEVAKASDTTLSVTEKVVNNLLDTIVTTVANKDNVHLVGFGKFTAVKRVPRKIVNPWNGEDIMTKGNLSVKFTAGRPFKRKVNGEDE